MLPTTPYRTFHADFQSTDDVDQDAELIELEDLPHTIEEIQEICRRYHVRARVFELGTGEMIGEVAPPG